MFCGFLIDGIKYGTVNNNLGLNSMQLLYIDDIFIYELYISRDSFKCISCWSLREKIDKID